MSTLYRATIKSFTPNGILVEVPALGTGQYFGPCSAIGPGDYELEQEVIVSNLNDIKEDLIILGPEVRQTYEDIVDGGDIINPGISDSTFTAEDLNELA